MDEPTEVLPLWFAFGDGQLGYHCPSCDQRCCTEAGRLTVTAAQLAGYEPSPWPALVSSATDNAFRVDIGIAGCPALQASGRCALHEQGGRLHKPVTCVLYPFNVLVRTDRFRVVAPRFSYVCPLVLDPPDDHARGDHRELAADIEALWGSAPEPFRLLETPAERAVSLDSERRVLEVVNAQPAGATLAAALAEAGGGQQAELRARAVRALEVLGLEPGPTDPEVTALLLPMVPALRLWFYSLELGDLNAALLVGERLAHLALGAGSAPRLRRISSLFEQHAELIGLVASAHRPVGLDGELRRAEGGVPEVALEVALVLRDAGREPGQHTLAELLARHVRAEGYLRTLVLRELSRAGLGFK